MNRYLLSTLSLVLSLSFVHAQNCLPNGITYTAQSQIDQFPVLYPGCSIIDGDVTILGTTIKNLNGLSTVERIGGSLTVTSCDSLQNITGLGKLKSIGDFFRLQNNKSLESLEGLASLTNVKEYFYIASNERIKSMAGLEKLDSVGNLFQIWSLDSLTTIQGMDSLSYIGGDFSVFKNKSLLSIGGLAQLKQIKEALRINENEKLNNLSGFNHTIDVKGALVITDNPALSNCSVETVCNYVKSPSSFMVFQNNAVGCNNVNEVSSTCISSNDEESELSDISVFPNPVLQNLSLNLGNFEGRNISLIIYNISGVEVYKNNSLNSSNIEIDFSGFNSGTYFLRLQTSQKTYTSKLLKI